MTVFAFSKMMGDMLFSQWERERFDVSVFPDLAYQAISANRPDCNINIFNIPSELLAMSEIPIQRLNQGSQFGQPPLTLYVAKDRKFFIEIYLWSSVDMTIHDHPFSGAFAVLEGVCRHDVYLFNRTGGARQVQTGVLKQQESELLSKGDCRKIYNGDRLIHRNLHLAKPTVTFIIRTFKEPGLTGMIFEESGLAVAPDLNATEHKFLDYLDGILKLNKQNMASEMIRSLLASDCGDYARYRAVEIYLERTGNYHETDLFCEMLSAAITGITPDVLRQTFLIQKSRFLNRDELH